MTIKIDIGSIVMNISAINARLSSIEGDIVIIQSDTGRIKANITSITGH